MTQCVNYAKYDKTQKVDFLRENYIINKLSIKEVAELAGVSPSTIKRDFKKLGIPARDKSDAQKLALESGRHKHPTKGTERDKQTKEKISTKMFNKWQHEIDREERSQKGKLGWEKIDPQKRELIQQQGFAAIKEAAKTGSKLEKYLLSELPKHGYKVSFHQEKMLGGTALQVDLLLDDLRVAIEVNGPSHREAIWGEKSFERTKRSDINKRALLQKYGFILIVVNYSKKLSDKRKEILVNNLLNILEEVKSPNHKTLYEVNDE